jgi:hypothetical protein
VKKASGKTKTEAKTKLKAITRDYEDGLLVASTGYTVADAVRNWLEFGLSGRDRGTLDKCAILANKHVIPALGARKLVDLSADDVDRWLADKSKELSTRSLRGSARFSSGRSLVLRLGRRSSAMWSCWARSLRARMGGRLSHLRWTRRKPC